MNIPQLKLLAARVRELLEQSSCPVGHSQALDLVAALSGLRNWPEVNAFPERVDSSQLDLAAAGRLGFRLRKKCGVDRSPHQLLDLLRKTVGITAPAAALDVWPGGPAAGVYLTTSDAAIQALLERYEEATDGAVLYAERAGSDHPASIDLGDNGLWSNGLDRVASGTLLVLGPVEFSQQGWAEAAGRINMACLRAYNERHRVAILVDTPSPATVFEDARLMVSMIPGQEDFENDLEIAGSVTLDGELITHPIPVFSSQRQAAFVPTTATVDAIPAEAVDPLRQALKARSTGLLLFGSSSTEDHWAIEQVSASLALTEASGPAARIMPRRRSTPVKDWNVPDPIKALPFLPSIESAYAQGYRRMVFDVHYTREETLLAYPDVLFIGGCYGYDVRDVARMLLLSSNPNGERALVERLIASLGVLYVPTKHGMKLATDLVVMPPNLPSSSMRFAEVEELLLQHRCLRWEEGVDQLLKARACSIASLKKELPRSPHVASFFEQRRKASMAAK